MTMQHNNTNINRASTRLIGTIVAVIGAICCGDAQSAGVTSRTPRPTSGANAVITASKSTTSKTNTAATATAATETKTAQNASETSNTKKSNIPTSVTNKSSYFASFLGLSESADTSGTSLADKVRAQRELLAAQSASNEILGRTNTTAAGPNACDNALRSCMTEKCGANFVKCSSDDATIWGTKIDACRRNTTCTGHEYALISSEILADRDQHERLSSYNAVINCGERYHECIITECGTTFGKCLGKSAGDHAISKCGKIANDCKTSDSGLAARVMGVFGKLRQDAEIRVQSDEKRLYALRDAMRDACKTMGAMFDERSLDCVYTVNFFAGPESKQFASKKAYAGASFTCDPNWFGLDVTTFMENAFRLTREQASATSAMLGSGIGVGVGAVTSGAIDRAVTTHAAKKELKAAEKEHDKLYGEGAKKAEEKQKKKEARQEKKEKRKAEKEEKEAAEKAAKEAKEAAKEAADKAIAADQKKFQDETASSLAEYQKEQNAKMQEQIKKINEEMIKANNDDDFDVSKIEIEPAPLEIVTEEPDPEEDAWIAEQVKHIRAEEDRKAKEDLEAAQAEANKAIENYLKK